MQPFQEYRHVDLLLGLLAVNIDPHLEILDTYILVFRVLKLTSKDDIDQIAFCVVGQLIECFDAVYVK